MLLNFVHNELANGSIGGEPIDSDDVIFTFSFSLIKLNSEFGILYKHSVSLSLSLSLSLYFAIQFACYCPLFHISLHTVQEISTTCVFKPGKVAAARRKHFALRFLFLSSPYVLLKLSDFFLFVLPIHLLHMIFMPMIIFLM